MGLIHASHINTNLLQQHPTPFFRNGNYLSWSRNLKYFLTSFQTILLFHSTKCVSKRILTVTYQINLIFINKINFQNGIATAIPNLSFFLASFFVGYSADKVMNSGKFSTGTVRKIYTSISHYGGALALILLAFSNCNKILSVAALCITSIFRAFAFSGFVVSAHSFEFHTKGEYFQNFVMYIS